MWQNNSKNHDQALTKRPISQQIENIITWLIRRESQQIQQASCIRPTLGHIQRPLVLCRLHELSRSHCTTKCF
jgi:hypothetical protein